MRLHIFNPEHDIALAANQSHFTAPHAGRQLRADLGFLPALWADDGDIVIVDDVEAAIESVRHIRKYVHNVEFIGVGDIKKLVIESSAHLCVEPWGWDIALREQLLRANSQFVECVPSDDRLMAIRMMSNRRFAAERLLPLLRETASGLVGESTYCTTELYALSAMSRYGRSVLKSPWSSSGRGVRYVHEPVPDEHTIGWMRNVINRQGGIMVEPLYPKVYDFGMEFMSTIHGVEYCGLSLFATRGGAYVGSLCATEFDKREILAGYVDMSLLDGVRQRICSLLQPLLCGTYEGPFGIDMMAVARDGANGFLLHPCVELNLRRTMGHVALALAPSSLEPHRIMSIGYTDKYRVRIQNSTANLLNTGLC